MIGRGSEAERFAAAYLQGKGLHLLQQNFRCRMGEIDLVMRDAEVLVFVEVRLRSRQEFGGAGASIGAVKQQRLIKAAQHYLMQYSVVPPCRFDAVLLTALDEQSVQWVKNAFAS